MGEFTVTISALRQRFREAFRIRSERAQSLDETMRETIMERLIEEYGSAQKAADAVWTLARQNEWYRDGEQAERVLLRRPGAIPAPSLAPYGPSRQIPRLMCYSSSRAHCLPGGLQMATCILKTLLS